MKHRDGCDAEDYKSFHNLEKGLANYGSWPYLAHACFLWPAR